MMLKEYLKLVCEAEKDVYEREMQINKTEKELSRVRSKVAIQKKGYEKKLQEKTEKITKVGTEKTKYENYKPTNFIWLVVITIVIFLATIIFHVGLSHLITYAFGATEIIHCIVPLLLANLIPAALIFVISYFGEVMSGLLNFLVPYVIINVTSFIYLLISTNKGITFDKAIFNALIFFCIIEVIIMAIAWVVAYKDRQSTIEHMKKMTKKKKDEINDLTNEINHLKKVISNYTTSSNKAINAINSSLSQQKLALEHSKKSLKDLYDKNIVHPNYRNWVAVATLYEYIDVGRCYELKGPNGAYNLYEQELLLNKIVDSLDRINVSIVSSGRNIVQSQNYIKSELQKSNAKLENIVINTYGF